MGVVQTLSEKPRNVARGSFLVYYVSFPPQTFVLRVLSRISSGLLHRMAQEESAAGRASGCSQVIVWNICSASHASQQVR